MKQKILDEIRRTAKQNGGIPLGAKRFKEETGITPYDVRRYWPRFGDAQKDAGFSPNQLKGAYTDEFVFENAIVVIRKLNKFPTFDELRVEKNCDSKFPSRNTFRKYGSIKELKRKLFEYSKDKSGYEDIVALCEPITEKSSEDESNGESNLNVGEVYLFKSGGFYKIGRTKDTVRRGSELRTQLPERSNMIHTVKTDDPSGVEAYWLRRFDSKRKEGEWFKLNSADIKAFKRWRKIF